MNSRDLYYRYSGRMPLHAPFIMLGAIVVAMAIVGAAYGVIVHYSPIIYLNLLGTLGVGMLSGWLAMKLGKAMRVRQLVVYPIAALIGAVVALDLAWIGWIFALSNWQAIIIDPISQVQVMAGIAEQGVWSLRGSSDPVKGLALYAVWALEAGTMLIAPVVVAMRMRDEAYCETTGRWLSDSREFGPFEPIAEPPAFRGQLEEDGFDRIAQLKPLGKQPEHGDKFTLIGLRHAGSAESTHLLRIDAVTMKVEKGKVNLSRSPIVRNMLIDRETHDLIAELLTPVPSADEVVPNDAAAPPTAPPVA